MSVQRTVAFVVVAWVMACALNVGLAGSVTDPRLLTAVSHGDVAAVRQLVKQGVDVNARMTDGTTALHWAVDRDNASIVELLIGAGARPNVADDYGVTPLWLACTNRSAAV